MQDQAQDRFKEYAITCDELPDVVVAQSDAMAYGAYIAPRNCASRACALWAWTASRARAAAWTWCIAAFSTPPFTAHRRQGGGLVPAAHFGGRDVFRKGDHAGAEHRRLSRTQRPRTLPGALRALTKPTTAKIAPIKKEIGCNFCFQRQQTCILRSLTSSKLLGCKFASLACGLSHRSASLLTLSTSWAPPNIAGGAAVYDLSAPACCRGRCLSVLVRGLAVVGRATGRGAAPCCQNTARKEESSGLQA